MRTGCTLCKVIPKCMELCIGIGDRSVKSLFVRTRGSTYENYIVIGICCTLVDQEKKANETFNGQLKNMLQLPILVTHERL